jgi:hypothetical protein
MELLTSSSGNRLQTCLLPKCLNPFTPPRWVNNCPLMACQPGNVQGKRTLEGPVELPKSPLGSGRSGIQWRGGILHGYRVSVRRLASR